MPLSQYAFKITILDTFNHKDGQVLTGVVEDGMIRVGADAQLKRTDGSVKLVSIAGIEKFRRQVTQAQPGDSIAVLIPGLQRSEVSPGDMLVAASAE